MNGLKFEQPLLYAPQCSKDAPSSPRTVRLPRRGRPLAPTTQWPSALRRPHVRAWPRPPAHGARTLSTVGMGRRARAHRGPHIQQ